MDLKALLPPSRVIVGVAGNTRREILCSLAQPLLRDGLLADLEMFLNDVERREDQVTTQAETVVALPHARSNSARRLGLTMGLAPGEGLVYDPDATERCRLFFLIAIPAFAPTAHLPLLQRLANFAHEPARVEKLLACPTPGKAARQIVTFKG